MSTRTLLSALALLTVTAALSSCGQNPAHALGAVAVSTPSASAAPVQAPSSEGGLRSSELTVNPTLLVQTRWFSGRVLGMSCTAPWWNQTQMNAQLQQNPIHLRVKVTTAKFFVVGSRNLRADFHLISSSWPQRNLSFQGTQQQGVLQVDGALSVLENGVSTPFGGGYVLDYDALGSGSAFRGKLDLKVACGTAGTVGPGMTYPGELTFHTDRV